MNQELLNKIESDQLRKDPLTFNVGDTVKVHTKVVEGEKERIQVFAGLVIGRRGHGINETFTVRRISYGEGVERVFPVNSPRIEKVVVDREGKVRGPKWGRIPKIPGVRSPRCLASIRQAQPRLKKPVALVHYPSPGRPRESSLKQT